jgi:hypothetical protein
MNQPIFKQHKIDFWCNNENSDFAYSNEEITLFWIRPNKKVTHISLGRLLAKEELVITFECNVQYVILFTNKQRLLFVRCMIGQLSNPSVRVVQLPLDTLGVMSIRKSLRCHFCYYNDFNIFLYENGETTIIKTNDKPVIYSLAQTINNIYYATEGSNKVWRYSVIRARSEATTDPYKKIKRIVQFFGDVWVVFEDGTFKNVCWSINIMPKWNCHDRTHQRKSQLIVCNSLMNTFAVYEITRKVVTIAKRSVREHGKLSRYELSSHRLFHNKNNFVAYCANRVVHRKNVFDALKKSQLTDVDFIFQ